jgi:tetratricopeptide (TPR) repeat protein
MNRGGEFHGTLGIGFAERGRKISLPRLTEDAKVAVNSIHFDDLNRARRMIPWKNLALLACLLLAARSAQAREADAKERAAKTACLAGDYVKGVAILSELYVSTNAPVYIYNQGRCFEQNHRYEDAVSRFREYLQVGRQISRADKADAQKHISDCQELLAKQGDSSSTHKGADAGNGDSRIAKERAAKKACLTGDADAGVALLADLYVDTNDANHIFNQGRCLEQVGRCEGAIIRFREYLRKTKDAGIASDGRAERHIADCEEILKKAKGGEGPPTADDSQPRRGSAASTALATATDVHGPNSAGPSQDMGASKPPAGVQASLPQKTPGRGLRIAGAVTLGVGVAGVAAGLGFALAANHLAGELEASPTSYQQSKESTRASYATASTVGYAAGAACVAGGVLLYYLGWRQSRASSATVEPMVSAQTAGALVQVAF